jgi:hypothetical protein
VLPRRPLAGWEGKPRGDDEGKGAKRCRSHRRDRGSDLRRSPGYR